MENCPINVHGAVYTANYVKRKRGQSHYNLVAPSGIVIAQGVPYGTAVHLAQRDYEKNKPRKRVRKSRKQIPLNLIALDEFLDFTEVEFNMWELT